jgi:hypothetical protein
METDAVSETGFVVFRILVNGQSLETHFAHISHMTFECSVLILCHLYIFYHFIKLLLLHFIGHVLNNLENIGSCL